MTNMSTAVYIGADDRSNGNVMDEEGEVRGATARPPPVDLGILNLDDDELTLVRLRLRNPKYAHTCVGLVHIIHLNRERYATTMYTYQFVRN